MVFPNSVSRAQTSPVTCIFSSLGFSSTDKTSWLATAAVMHR